MTVLVEISGIILSGCRSRPQELCRQVSGRFHVKPREYVLSYVGLEITLQRSGENAFVSIVKLCVQ